MVIDTSALVAILFGEADAERLATAIEQDPVRLISTATALEVFLVIESAMGEEGVRELDLLMQHSAIEQVPFTDEHLRVARQAFRQYGKGRNPAALNYGDCFSYALSKASGQALLFKGKDFPMTDVAICSLAKD